MSTLVLGLSTRALAESAVRCGHDIFTLDYFGDQDQKSQVENYSLARDFQQPFSAENLFKASEDLEFDSVIYTSNLENHPKVVEKLARRSSLLGNGSEVLCKVRDWKMLREFCRKNLIPHPLTLLAEEEKQAISEFQWLCKPVFGGGGSGIHPWSGSLIDDSQILQARVDGLPASATFVADGSKGVVLGLTQQLIGQNEFGAVGFTWCGNILPLPLEQNQTLDVIKEVEKMVTQLVGHFALKGINGIDFVISRGPDNKLCPFLIEINPRYTGSMELIERAYGLNIYSLHLNGVNGFLPEFSLSDYLLDSQTDNCHGKAIVFAPESVSIQNTHGWSEQGRKDIPFPGDVIAKGKPVCSILTKGETHNECLTNLFTGARNLRQEIYKT